MKLQICVMPYVLITVQIVLLPREPFAKKKKKKKKEECWAEDFFNPGCY